MKQSSIISVLLSSMCLAVFNMGCATQEVQDSNTLTIQGTVTYLQRIAMPDNAVLTVKAEEVSRADASAPIFAESTEQFGGRQVPLPFSLAVPKSAINSPAVVSLRATISVDNQLRFTSTQSYPLTEENKAKPFNLVLEPVSAAESQLTLPATFAGMTPCADCPGIEETLTLRPDHLFVMKMIYRETNADPVLEHGRWSFEDNKVKLSTETSSQYFMFVNDKTLQRLDTEGNPINTESHFDFNYSRNDGLAIDRNVQNWRGHLNFTNGASFTDCASGISWPVASTGGYAAVESYYRQARQHPDAAPIEFNGKLEQLPAAKGAAGEQIAITKFNGKSTAELPCAIAQEVNTATASLTNTYWKLVELDGIKLPVDANLSREIQITLASEGGRVSGFSGCNNIMGSFIQSGNKLKFSKMASTLMACIGPGMELESRVTAMLNATTHYRINGESLTLLASSKELARFESVYLR